MDILLGIIAGAVIYDAVTNNEPDNKQSNSMIVESIHLPSGGYKHNNEKPTVSQVTWVFEVR